MNTTKEKNFETIDSTQFQQDNLDFIEDIIESNLEKLFEIKEYSDISQQFSELNLKLLSSLNEQQRSLFQDYQNVNLTLNSYQNAFAYYLGNKETKK